MIEPATYEFRVRGAISDRTARTFEEVDMRCDTLVRAVVHDRAALDGILGRIQGLGLDIVEVQRVADHEHRLGDQ